MSNWFCNPMPEEISIEDIEAREDEFHHWKVEPIDLVESGYEGVIDKLKEFKATDYEKLDEAGKEKMVKDVLAIYRDVDVFPIQYFSEAGILNEISKCIEYPAKFDGDVVSCGAGVGSVLCNYLFPNLYDVPSQHDLTKDKEGAETAYLKFKSDEFLSRSIKFCFSYKNGCPVPSNVMGGLRLVGSTPTNFRPMNAKAIYERFAPKGGTIYDFCCVSGDTEFFNGVEWKKISDYVEGDKVLQYNEDGTAELVTPIEYIHYENEEPFYRYRSPYLSSCQTGNHDVVYIENGVVKKIKQDKILACGLKGIPVSCTYNGSKTIDYSQLKTLVNSVEYGNLLDYGDLTELSLSSKKALFDILVDEGIICKNTIDENLMYMGKKLEATKSIASMISTMGYSVNYITPYCIDINNCTLGSYSSLSFTEVLDSHKYCFVVPSHMLVLRYEGQVYITGNCGFGGRLLGCLSSKNNYKYVGTDPNTETMYNLHRLGEYIEMVTGREDSYELHCCGSEDFKGPANSVDFAFSSPPYFDLEVYSDEPTQCFNKFPVLEDWLEGYVRQTIRNIHHMLKPGCCYAVNIADFKIKGGHEVAYVDEWIRISTEEGMPLYDTVYLGVTARAGTKLQAAGELKKENILIFKKPL